MVALRDKYSKLKAQLKSENIFDMKQAKQTGGGPLKKISTKLVDKHEVFAQLAEIIALSINGHEALEGDEDFMSTSSNNATGNAAMGQSQSFSASAEVANAEVYVCDDSVDFEGFAVLEDEPSNGSLAVEELIVEEVVQPATVQEAEVLTTEPSPDASPIKPPHSKFTFQPPKRRRYALDADVTPVPTEKVEGKPTVKFLNPVACRQPLHKGLKVEKRFVEQEERSELRAKLGETENELLMAKIATERHKLHAAQLQLQCAQDEHKLKMQILREELAFAKLRKMRQRKAMNKSDSSSVDDEDGNDHYYDDVDHNDYPNSRNASPNASIL